MTLSQWAIARAAGIRARYAREALLCAARGEWGWPLTALCELAFLYGEYHYLLQRQGEVLINA
jgi:hypothetical protein